jgi:hypothetical protein
VALRLENRKHKDLFWGVGWWIYGVLSRLLVDLVLVGVSELRAFSWPVLCEDPRRAVAL